MKIPSDWKDLADGALKAQKNSYSPYSKFRVGAAIEDQAGRVYLGCNVENASYSESLCAERTAIVKLVSEGGKALKRIALVTDSKEVCFPCGACLQVIQEFGSPKILSMSANGEQFEEVAFEDLLPRTFTIAQLEKK